jgi:hypothetical protein
VRWQVDPKPTNLVMVAKSGALPVMLRVETAAGKVLRFRCARNLFLVLSDAWFKWPDLRRLAPQARLTLRTTNAVLSAEWGALLAHSLSK